jgi:hypothetical protein
MAVKRGENLAKEGEGALSDGAPFRQWALPEAMVEVRNNLAARAGGDRQFVSVLSVVSRYGLELVAAACAQVVAASKTISSLSSSEFYPVPLMSRRRNHYPYQHDYRRSC